MGDNGVTGRILVKEGSAHGTNTNNSRSHLIISRIVKSTNIFLECWWSSMPKVGFIFLMKCYTKKGKNYI